MLFSLSSLLLSCHGPVTHSSGELVFPFGRFRDGDLAFRRGEGVTSRAVLAADAGGLYSHVGILRKKDGVWFVIHAVPGEADVERIKSERIESFFAPEKAVCGAVMRFVGDSVLSGEAARHAERLYGMGILFDHDYDLGDTSRLYCTELVDFVYRSLGVDLPEGRISSIHIPGFQGDFLLPSDLYESKRLTVIFEF